MTEGRTTLTNCRNYNANLIHAQGNYRSARCLLTLNLTIILGIFRRHISNSKTFLEAEKGGGVEKGNFHYAFQWRSTLHPRRSRAIARGRPEAAALGRPEAAALGRTEARTGAPP